MIFDNIKNAQTYFPLCVKICAGLDFLQKKNLKTLPVGKYEILDGEIYALVQEYETKECAQFEAHKKFIDIQYIVEGSETLGVCEISNCGQSLGYDEARDLEFFNSYNEQCANFFTANEGDFAIFFPEDAHMPALSVKNKSKVKKVVVKVALD